MRQILNRMQSNERIATVHYVVQCTKVRWAVYTILVQYASNIITGNLEIIVIAGGVTNIHLFPFNFFTK